MSTTTGKYYQAAMLTQHKQTQLSKVPKLTQIKILPSIFTLITSHPARSAINCDVYVGGKVRVLELMRFFYLKHSGSKIISSCNAHTTQTNTVSQSHQTNKNQNSTVYFYSNNSSSCSQRHKL